MGRMILPQQIVVREKKSVRSTDVAYQNTREYDKCLMWYMDPYVLMELIIQYYCQLRCSGIRIEINLLARHQSSLHSGLF